MQRITITLDDELLKALDHVISECGYQNRSEAIRDLARAGIAQVQDEADDSPAAVGTLSFVYDHRERELAKRLTGSFHERHNLSVASMHVHLDHDSCLEIAVLRGATREVRDFAAYRRRARSSPRTLSHGPGRAQESNTHTRRRDKPSSPYARKGSKITIMRRGIPARPQVPGAVVLGPPVG